MASPFPVATSGPSFYRDISNASFTYLTGTNSTTLGCFAIKEIRWDRQQEVLRGEDNNVTRPVAAHTVRIKDNFTITTEDGNFAYSCQALQGCIEGTFAYDDLVVCITDTETASPGVTVSVAPFIIEDVRASDPTKALHNYVITGFALAVPGSNQAAADPVTVTAL